MAGLGQEAVRLDLGTSRWTTYEVLNFQCETPDGAFWFVSRDSGAVRYDGQRWTRYGVEDGLIDTPRRLIATREGIVWAAGGHGPTAATARFDGKRWSLQTHPGLSRFVSSGAVYEASDGALWFGSGGGHNPGQVGGALRFDGVTWTHHTPPEAPQQVTSIGQTPDGAVWFGGWIIVGLRVFDGKNWMRITEPEELTQTWISAVSSTSGGDLWVGTRTFGLFRYDGRAWTRHDVQDGLADTWVRDILQTDDGSLWVSTGKGISRFDGRTWTTHVLPPGLTGGLNQSRDGALWINFNRWFGQGGSLTPIRRVERTIRYLPDTHPPETEITLSLNEVSQPGNTPLAWKGADPWRETQDSQLQYSHRLNGGEWSPFSEKTSDVFLSLSGGDHTFEVKARDRDFNEDPTPAVTHFTVVPLIWKQPWFIGLIAVFVCTTGFLISRIVVRNRKLQELDTLKTDFLSNVSHELRTLMTAIKGFVDNMLDGIAGDLNERQDRYLTRIKSNADRLTRLINDLLDVSRLDRGRTDLLQLHLETLPAREIISEAVESLRPMAESAGLTLTFKGEDVTVRADRDRLVQVVTNLVGNAVKFTDSGGEVSVEVKSDGAEYVQTVVQDTGRGIPAADLDQIFDRFYRVKGEGTLRPGTGLGLPITKELVELQGGQIRAESEVGVGSTFTFTLPEVRE